MCPAGVLHIEHICDDRVHGCWRVQVGQMPTDMGGIRPAEALLNHVHVQDVNLAEVHPAQG